MKDKKKVICFDMDGTIVDLYGVPDWLAKLEREDVSPYEEARPLYDMDALNYVCQRLVDEGWEIHIVSWYAKNASDSFKIAIRKAKRDWLLVHQFPCELCHFVAYGVSKVECMNRFTYAAVLVDDNSRIRRNWSLGETIDPAEGDLIEKLNDLLSW